MPQTKLHNGKINACIINNNKLCAPHYGPPFRRIHMYECIWHSLVEKGLCSSW